MPQNEPEYGDVPARPTYTIDGVEVTYEEHLQHALIGHTDEEVKDDLETLARVVEENMGLEPGLVSTSPEFRDLMSDPIALEALLGEAVMQIRGPLHYAGDVAADVMRQLIGPDRTGEALVPVEATYSLDTNRTEVFYRVATPADVEAHVAAVGRSMS